MQDSADSLVTDGQKLASVLSNFFTSFFSTTADDDNITQIDVSTNDESSSASVVDSQDTVTGYSCTSNSNSRTHNIGENSQRLDQQNSVHEIVIMSEHTVQNFEVTTKDILVKAFLKFSRKQKARHLAPLHQGLIPADWKTANVTHVFKNGDRNMTRSYRLISLTLVTDQMLESILRNRILCST